MAFVACGLIAGAISFAIFDREGGPDPRDAMALAPAAALNEREGALPAIQSEKRAPAQKGAEAEAGASAKTGTMRPTCRENLGELRQGDCPPVRIVRIRPPRATNEQPLIAAAPIGHRDDPTMIPASPQNVAAEDPNTSAPTQVSVSDGAPSEAAAPVPAPSNAMVAAKRPRPRVHHASRSRSHDSYASSYSPRGSRYGGSGTYAQSGYARLW
jgi:hypothetical protein